MWLVSIILISTCLVSMVRHYNRKTPPKYAKEDVARAVRAVKECKMSQLLAAKKFNVPRTTLRDHLYDPSLRTGAGRSTFFSVEEEREMVASLQALQQIGFGLTRELAGIVIHDYLIDQPHRCNPFKDNLPGKDWWTLFMKRWCNELSLRKPQHLPTHRAVGASKDVLNDWFEKVGDLMEKTGLNELPGDELQKRLWNCDETGFCLSTTSKHILSKRGEREVQETVGGSGREFITLLAAASADGTRLPPFIVYKAKHLWSRWTKGGPNGVMYSVSDSGWMESANFLQWFEKMFVPAVRHITPIILFFDGHHSHLTLRLIEVARSNNIHLICFPPHVTHILQPLDVGVFGPLKSSWRTVLKKYQIETGAANVTKQDFPPLIAQLFGISFRKDHIKGGFKKSGIYPLDRSILPQHKFDKGIPFVGPSDKNTTPQEQGAAEEEEGCMSVHVTGNCTINECVTPIRLELKCYFADILQKKTTHSTSEPADKQKVKAAFYGEALTTDETYQRLIAEQEEKTKQKEELQKKREEKKEEQQKKKEEQEMKRKEKREERQKKKEEQEIKKREKKEEQQRKREEQQKKKEERQNRERCRKPQSSTKVARRKSHSHSRLKEIQPQLQLANATEEMNECCKVCHEVADDDEELWIGCDACSNWYHYPCINLPGIPDDDTWLCPYCEGNV